MKNLLFLSLLVLAGCDKELPCKVKKIAKDTCYQTHFGVRCGVSCEDGRGGIVRMPAEGASYYLGDQQ